MTVIIFTLTVAILLFIYLKKGTLLHEIFHLPEYWLRVLPVATQQMQRQRVRYGNHHRQYFWLLRPLPHRLATDKVILWFHGGGWRHGRAEMFMANAQVMVNAGHSVVLVSYRLAPRFNYYAMREDLNLLLPTVLRTIDYPAFQQKIIVGGMSAGATLAALLLYDRAPLTQLRLSQTIFSGAMFFGAPLELNGMPDNFVLRSYAGRKSSPQFKAANPVTYLNPDEQTPVLVVQGKKDGLQETFETALQALFPQAPSGRWWCLYPGRPPAAPRKKPGEIQPVHTPAGDDRGWRHSCQAPAALEFPS